MLRNAGNFSSMTSQRVIFGRNYSTVYPPTSYVPNNEDGSMPLKTLERGFVFGYNGEAVNNVYFVSETQIVYTVASLCVIHDIQSNTQSYFDGHSTLVTCLDFNLITRRCASGQRDPKGAEKPPVLIWSIDNPHKTIETLRFHKRYIIATKFNTKGDILVSIGADSNHCIAVWRNLVLESHITYGRSPPESLGSCCDMFHITCDGALKLLDATQNPALLAPGLSTREGICAVLVGPSGSGLSLSLDSRVFVLTGSATTGAGLEIPTQPRCAAWLNDTTAVLGCDKSCVVAVEVKPSLKILWKATYSHGPPRSFIAITCFGSRIVVGSSRNTLHLIEGGGFADSPIQKSHMGEVWAMALHPKKTLCATASDKGDVLFWDLAKHAPLSGRNIHAEEPVYSLAFSPNAGELFACGMEAGYLSVATFPDFTTLFARRLSRDHSERISDVRFSPNEKLLAAASWDQKIYILRVHGVNITLAGALVGNSASPTGIQFSADSRYLMATSKDTQILYWSTQTGKRVTFSGAFRDVKWQEGWSCPIGWPVLGVWGDDRYDETDVNTVHQAGSLMCIGDDYGGVKLFRYPCPVVKPQYREFKGHYAAVTRVMFAPDRQHVMSVGGMDKALIIWRVKEVPKVVDGGGRKELIKRQWTNI